MYEYYDYENQPIQGEKERIQAEARERAEKEARAKKKENRKFIIKLKMLQKLL